MNTTNLLDPKLTETLATFRDALTTHLQSNLLTVALYGSAARGLYQPGFSDINLLLVLTEADPPALAAVRTCLNAVDIRWRITPYLVTLREWPQLLHTFPTRILEMQRGYELIFGRDLLKEATVDRQALAARTQQELLNILLRFRHRLLASHDPAALEADLRGSLPAFIKVLRTLVFLRTSVHHDDRQQVIQAGAAAYGFSEPAFLQLLAWRQGQVILQGPEWEAAADSFLEGLNKVAGSAHV